VLRTSLLLCFNREQSLHVVERSVAKIASAFQKPDGLTIVKPGDVIDFLSPLPVSKISGIGRKTEKHLNNLGIYAIGELADADTELIRSEFGEVGIRMQFLAKGVDEEEVKEREEIKSIGYEQTFDIDTDDKKIVEDTIDQIAEKIHKRLHTERYGFKTITVKVRFEDFDTHTRSKTIRTHSNNREEIKTNSQELITTFIDTGKKIRLIGVRVSNLKQIGFKQMRLYDYL